MRYVRFFPFRFRFLGIVFGFIGMVLAPLARSPVAAQPTGDRLTEIREIVRDRVKEQKTHAGIVVGVVDAEGRRTFGYGQTQDGGARVDSSTIFEIGSLTKVFTGLLLADAVERDIVSLGTPVEKALPITVNAPAQNGKEITVRHLVTHTSGLPRLPANLSLRNREDPYANYTIRDLYHAVNKGELKSVPGTKREYSNFGFGLLGHALARRQDTAYTSLVRSRIADPLEMSKTRIAVSSADSSAMATGHDSVGRSVPYWSFTEALAGAGALHASTNDLLTFLEAQLGLRTVPDRLAEAIDRSHTVLHDGEEEDVAYGWHVRSVNGRQTFWHNGRTGGFASFMAFDPERELGVVVIANSARSVDDLGFRLLNRKAELESVYNPHRRFTVEAGIVNDHVAATRGRIGISYSYFVDRRGRLQFRPYLEYSRFGVSTGTAEGDATPASVTFDTGTLGVAFGTQNIFSALLRWLDLPGKIFTGAEARLHYAFRVDRRGLDSSPHASRWAYQFGQTFSYRRGSFVISVEGLRSLQALGDGKLLDRLDSGGMSTLSVGYRF